MHLLLRVTSLCRSSASSLRSKGLANCFRRLNGFAPRSIRSSPILGVALTMFDRRNNLSQAVAEDVRACLGPVVFDTVVPRNVRLSEAPSHGLPALIYDLQCPGSEAYVRLARELISRLPQAGGGRMSSERPGKGLGMGLSALLGDSRTSAAAGDAAHGCAAAFARSRSRRIRPNPNQPRVQFREETIDELADSIAERGVLQPILLAAARVMASRSSRESGAGGLRKGRGSTPFPPLSATSTKVRWRSLR